MNRKYTRLIAKILGLLLALMMIIGVCAPAMAAAVDKEVAKDAKGSITVTSDESGWTATAYKVINVNFNFDKQQPEDPVYTWNNNVATWVKENYGSYISDVNAVTNQFQDFASSVDPQFGQEVRSFVDALAKKVRESKIQEVSTASESNRTAKMDNLEMGGYLVLVESTTGTKIYAPGFVNIYPSYDETQNKWVLKEDNANANMAIKSSDPTIVKTADKATVAIGDTVTYTLEMDVPQYPENTDYKTFVFGDKLPSGLQLVSDSLKIFSKDAMTDKDKITEQFQQTNSPLQEATFEYGINDCSKLNCTKIYVQYKATVVSPAYDSRDNLKNTAYLLYDQNPYDKKDTTKRKTSEVQLYTYGIQLTKTGENDSPMAGAEFKLKKDDTEIKVEKDVKDGIYYPSANGKAVLTSAKDSGKILIKGLDVGTYTLEETKAPAGYTLPNEKNRVLTITLVDKETDGNLDKESTVTGGILKKDSVNVDNPFKHQLNFIVTNSKSNFNLPITGGVGTILFTVAGIMVMAGAVVLMTYAIRRKKRSSMK